MKKPWQTIKSKLTYKNNWIKLYHDEVIRPDGKPGIYGHLKTRGGIGVVAVNRAGKIYLVEQYRYPLGKYSLEIPKGTFNSFTKINPLETAKRELREECGLVADKWVRLGKVHTLVGFSNDFVYLFLANDLRKVKSSPEGTEDIKIKLASLNGEEKIIGKITDATSLAAISLARKYLKK